MPRDPKTLTPDPCTPLTPSDHIFLDEVENLLHLSLDRLRDVLESIKPPTKYDAPAPDVPRDPEGPSPFMSKPDISFVPYAREFLRSVKGLQTICHLWAMLKSARTQSQTNHAPFASNPGNTGIPACDDSHPTPVSPTLLKAVENYFKTPLLKPTPA